MKIENNIPPPTDSGKGRSRLYPFPEMKVGDSILVDNRAGAMCAYQYGLRHKWRFTVRTVKDKYRIWRTK